MTISVIVPVFNCEPDLPACIRSILNQTHTDLDIILIDDGSTDGSPALCDSFAADPRVRVVHQVNQGVSAARNAGLDIARGDMITFVDADDTIEPDMYEILVKLAQEHQADIAHCGYKKVYLDGTQKEVSGTELLLVQNSREATVCLLEGRHFTGSPCTKLYRRHLFDQVRFDTNLKINEDVLMNMQVFQASKTLVFWDITKYHYREHRWCSWNRVGHIKARKDGVAAAEKTLDLFRGTDLETLSAGKLYYTLLALYRAMLFEDKKGTKQDRREIHSRIQAISPLCKNTSTRSKLNYAFMHNLPWLYLLTYRTYEKLRTPNNDLQ